ncbi:hypothetical protein ACOMHN_050366 [Nucella lapillus]
MGLSAAEKQRRYREKRDTDPEKRKKWLDYQRDKYRRDKQQGKKKLVRDMTVKEHRREKMEWKRRQQASRDRKRTVTVAGQCRVPQVTAAEVS